MTSLTSRRLLPGTKQPCSEQPGTKQPCSRIKHSGTICFSRDFWIESLETLQSLYAIINLHALKVISTLGRWHPDAHRALCSVATAIAARGLSTFSSAKSILFQRHAALLATNNALCLMTGLVSGILAGTYCST